MKSAVEIFNFIYDFVARLITLGIFVAAVTVVARKWKYIDWRRTGKDLIEKHSPIQLQPLERVEPLRVDSTATEAGPDQASPPGKPATVLRPAAAADFLNVYQFGQLVFTADRPYEIVGDTIVFDKLLLKGRPDYGKPFLYAGREIIVTHIEEYIGLLVSGGGVEGPVLRGVACKVTGR